MKMEYFKKDIYSQNVEHKKFNTKIEISILNNFSSIFYFIAINDFMACNNIDLHFEQSCYLRVSYLSHL